MPQNINIIIHLKVYHPGPSGSARRALHVQSRSYWAPANIGPYSQAVSTPLSHTNGQDTEIRTVAVAGQIPLIPHTMSLPKTITSNETSSMEIFALRNFKLQAVLSLQHLWRIGIEMDVQWWTNVVAYLPHASPSTIAEHTAIAAQAWTLLHERPTSDDSEDNESPDLWEEKYYAGMEVRGGSKIKKMLPDWDTVVTNNEVGDGERIVPPFWAAEVEELPRGSGIEWHAGSGIANGPVQVGILLKPHSVYTNSAQPFQTTSDEGWSIHQCVFGIAVQSIVMIKYSEDISNFSKRLDAALKVLGDSSPKQCIHASYLDVTIPGIWNIADFGGRIPCRSILDISGQKLAAVFIVENMFRT